MTKIALAITLLTFLFGTYLSYIEGPIGSKNVKPILAIGKLKSLCQSLATLDAIIEPNWQYRYWSFNANWAKNESVGSMRDGSGDDLFVWFGPPGATIKGFAHESPMSPHGNNKKVWKGVLDKVPQEFKRSLNEPAFDIEATTFFIWRTHEDKSWQVGPVEYADGDDPDGSIELLKMFDGNPKTYKEWASSYYEKTIPLSAVKLIYDHKPLTDELIKKLNPDNPLEKMSKDLKEIGYPVSQ